MSEHSINRRQFVRVSVLGATTATGVAGRAPRSATGADKAGPDVRPQIDVYTGAMSYAPGEQLALHVSTTATRYAALIERVGAERRRVWSQDALPGELHPTPKDASTHGCRWPAALRVDIPREWQSGVYRVELTADDGSARTETFFILRAAEPGKHAKILFQLSTNTYQAYNAWGGTCLYSGPDYPRASFDRPFQISPPVTKRTDDFYNPNTACYQTWDEPFIAWAERSGYALEYCANLDLELQPELLKNYRLVLSVGHDEYWSAGMRDRLEAFIAGGGNAAFLSGNSVCWQVRVEDSGRALVCHKMAYQRDPVFATGDHSTLTTLWSNPAVARPENHLTGVGFPCGGYNGFFHEFQSGPGAGEYVTHREEHWLLAGTGLERGEPFGRLAMAGPQPGIAGYECDGCEFVWRDGLPVPTGRDGTPTDFEILATAPARWSKADGSVHWARDVRGAWPASQSAPADAASEERLGAAVMGIYERGGTVVTVGSCGWPYGLAVADHVIDRIARNLLDRLSV